VPVAHVVPAAEHTIVFTVHAPVVSHVPEQHAEPLLHGVPNKPHTIAASGGPGGFFLLLPHA
jgi:hypothetical protein